MIKFYSIPSLLSSALFHFYVYQVCLSSGVKLRAYTMILGPAVVGNEGRPVNIQYTASAITTVGVMDTTYKINMKFILHKSKFCKNLASFFNEYYAINKRIALSP